MKSLVNAIDRINKLLHIVLAILMAGMAIVISYQVVIRFLAPYLDITLPRWTEELARYLMIWLVFLGSALAVRYSALIGVETIAERLRGNWYKGLKIFVLLVSVIFFALLVVYGFTILGHVSKQLSPGLKWPMTIPFAAIPIGGILMIMNSVAVFIELLTGQSKKTHFQGAE